jgi:hypothetical protein
MSDKNFGLAELGMIGGFIAMVFGIFWAMKMAVMLLYYLGVFIYNLWGVKKIDKAIAKQKADEAERDAKEAEMRALGVVPFRSPLSSSRSPSSSGQ